MTLWRYDGQIGSEEWCLRGYPMLKRLLAAMAGYEYMCVDRYLPAARQVAQPSMPGLLAQRGLKPFISRYVLTETQHGQHSLRYPDRRC